MDIRAAVKEEIAKLQRVLAVLDDVETSRPKTLAPKRETISQTGVGHSMSMAARRKIAAAQKARWAKQKVSSPSQPKRAISAASRRKMAAAQRARWAKVKSQQKKAA